MWHGLSKWQSMEQIGFPIFFTMFWMQLEVSHFSITRNFSSHFIHSCVCTHLIDPIVSTSYVVLIVINVLELMMQFVRLLLPLHEMLTFTWDENNYMHFFQSFSTPFVAKSTLCSQKMTFIPKLTLSLPTQCKWIYFPDLAQFKDLLPSMWLKPKKGAITTNTP